MLIEIDNEDLINYLAKGNAHKEMGKYYDALLYFNRSVVRGLSNLIEFDELIEVSQSNVN